MVKAVVAEPLSGKVRFLSSPCLGCSPRPLKSCGGSNLRNATHIQEIRWPVGFHVNKTLAYIA